MKNPADVIDKLGGYREVAIYIGHPLGTVASWKSRKAIPMEVWPKLINLARVKKVRGVNPERLLAMHAPSDTVQ